MIDGAISELTPIVGVRRACRAVGEDQARFYRRHRQSSPPVKPERLPGLQPRALTEAECTEVRDTLNSAEFVDESPPTVYATLLDSRIYLCSVPTMYRVLRRHGEVHERRRQATHPATVKPELVALGPNQVWSWDITKLHGPAKWTYYYLYVVIDIFSRYVTAWMLARGENSHLAKVLVKEAVAKQGIRRGQLSLHMDRGSPMRAKPFAFLLADLGVTKSYSRPHVSDDNPYSESAFRTFKYRPTFPDRFGSYQDAHSYCARFFPWYNDEHRHSGIGYHTPSDVHYGRAELMREQRQKVLTTAYIDHPERFVRKPPGAACDPSGLVDQRTEGGGGFDTVIRYGICLKKVDKRRREYVTHGHVGNHEHDGYCVVAVAGDGASFDAHQGTARPSPASPSSGRLVCSGHSLPL